MENFSPEYDISRSIRYHKEREAFYDRMLEFLMFFNTITGGISIYLFCQGEEPGFLWGTTFFLLALFNMGSLVFGHLNKVTYYREMWLGYDNLMTEHQICPKSDETKISIFKEFKKLEGKEKDHYKVVNILKHNEVKDSLGQGTPDQKYYIPLTYLLLRNFFKFKSFSPITLQESKENHTA